MNTIKEQLFSGWHTMRWIRLVIGIVAMVEAISSGEAIFGLVAVFLFFQVYSNTGCDGSAGCALPERKISKKEDTKVKC